MIVKLLTERHLEFLSLKGGCTGSSESTLVKMSNCWKSHALAQMSLFNSLHAVYFFMLLLLSAEFFNMSFFSSKNTYRVSHGLDTDQDRPDLGPNCLQRLSADDKRQR